MSARIVPYPIFSVLSISCILNFGISAAPTHAHDITTPTIAAHRINPHFVPRWLLAFVPLFQFCEIDILHLNPLPMLLTCIRPFPRHFRHLRLLDPCPPISSHRHPTPLHGDHHVIPPPTRLAHVLLGRYPRPHRLWLIL